MDRGAPLLLAALLAALPALADDEGGLPPLDPIEEEAQVPCGPSGPEAADPGEPGEPGRSAAPTPAPRARAGRAPDGRPGPRPDPCAGIDAPDGRRPDAAAPPAPDPVAEAQRGEERRARQRGAGRNAARQAQALIGSLSPADSGAAPTAGAAPRAAAAAAPAPGAGVPGELLDAADLRRLNQTPQAQGPTTLRTFALPDPAGARKPGVAKAPEAPAWRRAWDATKRFVDEHTPSPYKLADDVSYEASVRFKDTSSHNTEQDAWRHARWHQRMVDSLCPETGRSVCAPVAAGVAMAAGTVHELMGAVSGQPASEFKMDMNNNWKGALAGIQGNDPRLIDRALASGTLVVLTPSAPTSPMVARR